jgi:hypothetical protein
VLSFSRMLDNSETTFCVSLVLAKGGNEVDIPFPQLKTDTFTFRNVIFSSYLELPTMEKFKKPSDSDNYSIDYIGN